MKNIFANTFFPKKCAFCGRILPAISKISGEERVLCAPCRGKWETEKNAPCRRCKKRICECRCPKDLLWKSGVRTHLKVAFYRPGDEECVANKLVHTMKYKNDAYVFSFAAEQLGRAFLRYVVEKDIDAGDIVMTYVPRLDRSVKKYGYDHAKLLASIIAKSVSLEAAKLIKRVGKSTEQKYLTKSERVANVEGVFEAESAVDLKGKTVFLVDDVVTSGASMGACAKILRESGAENVVALSFAATK